MLKTVKTTFITSMAIACISTSAQAQDHSLITNWSPELSASENFENTVTSVTKYCQTEARQIDRREMSFRKRFERHCQTQLIKDFVAKTGTVEIEELYAAYQAAKRAPKG